MTNDIERVKQYLIQHKSESSGTSEGQEAYNTRLERLYRRNHTAPYVEMHWAHMCQRLASTGADDARLSPARLG